MTKIIFLDVGDRKLLIEIKRKLDEATKLLGELMETIDVLSSPEMLKDIFQGLADIKAGRAKDFRQILEEESSLNNRFFPNKTV